MITETWAFFIGMLLFCILPIIIFIIWGGINEVKRQGYDHCKEISKDYKELELCVESMKITSIIRK